LQLTGLFFLLSLFKKGRNAMMIARPNGVEGLAAASVTDSKANHVKFAKLAIAACTAIMLVGLYAGVKQTYAIGSFTSEQSRVFHINVSEACMNGTEAPPLLEAREGDHIELAVTSLFPGGLYLHGLETEVDITPGMETTITFTAQHAGRFFLHLHGDGEDQTHAELAVLEVAPRQP
jgi:FtsP/CotA-like multicopper oxidase with cupredoxin domain